MTQATLAPFEGTTTADVVCDHCGLPVPRSGVREHEPEQFCCDGCRTVFAVIRDAGLGRYYRERADAGALGRRASGSDKTYAELDDPLFVATYCRELGPDLLELELYLENLHCPACVWLVERLGRVVPGIVSASVDLGRSTVRVLFPPSLLRPSEVARGLAGLGYLPHPRQSADAAELRRNEDRALLSRMAVAGAVFANVMLFGLALYAGAFQGMDADYRTFFRAASLIVVTPAVLWSARVFHRGAWASIRARTPHMDLPVSIGILAGFSWGALNVIRGRGEIYFDSVSAVIFLLLVGRWLQRRRQHAATDAAELLFSLAPSSARLLVDGEPREVPTNAVPTGGLLQIRAGETFPADGVVTLGESTVDASLLSGETRPEEIAIGSRVHAGTVNVSAEVIVRAEETGQATRIGRLLQTVRDAAARRAPTALAADRAAGRFVVVALGLALLTLVGWWQIDKTRALENAIALLVVTCPCALGLATPLAVTAAIGKAAGSGVLIKGGDALERLDTPALVVFDKTGTLTEGRLELAAFHGDKALEARVAAVEARSAHPIARAFTRALGEGDATVTEYCQVPGGGVSATVDGRRLHIGSVAFVRARAEVPTELNDRASRAGRCGETPVLIAESGTACALACFRDPIRRDARESLGALLAMGHRLAILSGDQPEVVESVARQLDLPLAFALGGASPEDKLAVIEREAERGAVVMVGDGVNDAAALARAHVGIAVHGGAEASLAAADAFTTEPGVLPVLRLFTGARRTFRVIRRNILLSLGYNAICATLAVFGAIAPWIAAILMPLSSLTVVTSSYRSKTFERKS
ncbi:MAG: heavy metal translocating P-type ATPase [Myxococcales bacterium]|nr:heavy metal translocating P-type ATPase [Myxococcales bacterium]